MSEPPIKGMKTEPSFMYGDGIMEGAFIGLVTSSVTLPGFHDEFTEKTGLNVIDLISRTPLETAINSATGHAAATVAAYADFVAERLWGLEGQEETE